MALGLGTVNKVILLGRLGQDPELRYTPAGAAVANFSVATNRVWKDQEGNQVKKTDWHRIVVWRKTAEFANTYLKKGSLVYLEGRLETRSWTDQNNVTRYITEVIADSLEMVGPKQERAEGAAEIPPPAEEFPPQDQEQPPTPATDNNVAADSNVAEDDLPF